MNELSIGQCVSLACVLEATAPKPGNVHRGADFADLSYPDFLVSAIALGPVFDQAPKLRLGELVLSAIDAMRGAVDTNTYLGTILLLAPLAKAKSDKPWKSAVERVLAELNADDARLVYEAIRRAGAGSLGRAAEHDIAGPPPADLLAAMRAAADRDLVARQYAEGFAQVLDVVVPALEAGLARGWGLLDAIVRTHLTLMSELPDSLIARKCGRPLAERAAAWAADVLRAGEPGSEAYAAALADFDFWLRSDSNRRNPGTTADLVAAGLFVCLREGSIRPPFRL
jgi:triphosphoribosyl-dephospho-CoA synthase